MAHRLATKIPYVEPERHGRRYRLPSLILAISTSNLSALDGDLADGEQRESLPGPVCRSSAFSYAGL